MKLKALLLCLVWFGIAEESTETVTVTAADRKVHKYNLVVVIFRFRVRANMNIRKEVCAHLYGDSWFLHYSPSIPNDYSVFFLNKSSLQY